MSSNAETGIFLIALLIAAVAPIIYGILSKKRTTAKTADLSKKRTEERDSFYDICYPKKIELGVPIRRDEYASTVENPRLDIRYIDAEGNQSDRIIRVLHVNLRQKEIIAFCENKQAERTFLAKRIVKACNPRTGQQIVISEWLNEVREARYGKKRRRH